VSLIYTALNSLEPDADAKSATVQGAAPRVAQIHQPSATRWLYLTLIGCLTVVVIGIVALVLLRDRYLTPSPPVAGPAAAPAAVAMTPAPAASVVASPAAVAILTPIAPVPAPMPQPAPAVAAPPVMATTLPPMDSNTLAPMVVTAAPPEAATSLSGPAPAAREPAPAPRSRIEVERIAPPGPARRPATAAAADNGGRSAAPAAIARNAAAVDAQPASRSAGEPDLDEANRLAIAVQQAIDAGRMDDAAAQLKQLATRLPAESITLLRLHAWYALRSGDSSRAQALYRQIVDRLPDDEPASINLAVLQWRAGRRDEARRVIAALAERRPESETVRRYSAQFEERP
jgi:Tetratricopeptide repeat